ncbi:MAG: 1-acyl-sn-glycerol-3-phosphate acyltransferase [Muribaculaceae bacterium]|nr:1-acyl-sn-glycerol-3-phosphate acyltransferase [Muribaculaceae bacterium]
MNLARTLLKWAGWSVNITVPDYPKCIICVAPHTSNYDFIIGKLVYASVGRKAGFLMKSTWFFPPLGWIFKSIGGIPVHRGKGSSLVSTLIEKFNDSQRLCLAITPEGTRSRTEQWRTGFLRIAYGAHIPIVLGVIDFGTKSVSITTTFEPTGDIDADMRAIKKFYKASGAKGRHPEKFSTD